MNRSVHTRCWMIWVWAACISLACSDKPEGTSAALYGVGNLVSVNDLLFTLSTDHNELRVLNLNSSDRVRGPHFMPAVNPLEPLSIPVLAYPNILASDLRWEDEVLDSGERISQGKLIGGPLVYVASRGRGGVSIVGGGAEWLKELKYFPTEAPITALAAYRGDQSTLFFATYDGDEGSLWALDLQSEQAVFDMSSEDLLARQRLVKRYLGQVITALSVLPEGALAIAVREAGSATAALHLLDGQQSPIKTVKLQQAFRLLTTHAAAKHAGALLPAGKWLYAVLDEGSCVAEPCESGIVAVDVAAGVLAPERVIPSVGGVPVAVEVASVGLQGAEALVGFYVTGSGLIGMFDAAVPGPLEAAKAVSATFFSPNEAGELVEASYLEGPLRNEDGTPIVQAASGAILDETILIGAEALVPGCIGLPTADSDKDRFPISGASPSRIQEGDVLEVFVGEVMCAELVVKGIDEVEQALVTEEPVPDACAGRSHFQLRAGQRSENPYVVAGTKTGYLGRAKPGEVFSAQSFGAEPMLSIEFGSASFPQVRRGARWELVLTSGYWSYARDIQSFSGCSTRIAAGIWIDSVRRKLYISFSSSNALMEIDIQACIEGSLGEAEVACYR